MTIKRVVQEKIYNPRSGEREAWVIYFENAHKGLVLNKINAFAIAELAGVPDTEAWQGLRVELYPSLAKVGGQEMPCIRVRKPPELEPEPQEVSS